MEMAALGEMQFCHQPIAIIQDIRTIVLNLTKVPSSLSPLPTISLHHQQKK